MLDWIREHDALMWWLGVASAVTFVGTLLLLPMLVARIPAAYFVADRSARAHMTGRHPVVRATFLVAKNVLGGLFIAAGFAMLFVPGQGVLTILIGIMLMNFPGKHALERWLIKRRPILRSVNWMRTRTGRPPLRMPPDLVAEAAA